MYKKPSLESMVIDKIKIGEKISAEEIPKTEQSINIGNEFSLEGNFVKVRNELFTGFVFSSDWYADKIFRT